MDDCFWEELSGLDPDDVCRRSGAAWQDPFYRIRMLGTDYMLTPATRQMRCVDSDTEDEEVVPGLSFAAVHYLLNATDTPPSGELVAASELKGGKLFFAAGAHSPDFSALEAIFAASPQAAERAAAALGGGGVAQGDAAVEIQALPRLPITFIYWAGDEEFPASTSMLFDRTAEKQLPLDVILALAQETMRQLVERGCEALNHAPS